MHTLIYCVFVFGAAIILPINKLVLIECNMIKQSNSDKACAAEKLIRYMACCFGGEHWVCQYLP